jgi:AraC family transcriptional regulator
MSLIDIALAVGFSSQSHLNDYFRRIVGVTPARYRAEVRPHGRDLSRAEYRDS